MRFAGPSRQYVSLAALRVLYSLHIRTPGDAAVSQITLGFLVGLEEDAF